MIDMSISLQTGLYELCRLRMEKDAEFLSEHPDADIEHVDDALFDEYRLFQLKRTVRRVRTKSPFYRRVFEAAGVTEDELNSLADIAKLPFTTPQDLVGMIVRKAVHMANMMKITVLGIVENISYAVCPDCGKQFSIFGESHVEEEAAKLGLPVLARLPIDPQTARLCVEGHIERVDGAALQGAVDAIEPKVGLNA